MDWEEEPSWYELSDMLCHPEMRNAIILNERRRKREYMQQCVQYYQSMQAITTPQSAYMSGPLTGLFGSLI